MATACSFSEKTKPHTQNLGRKAKTANTYKVHRNNTEIQQMSACHTCSWQKLSKSMTFVSIGSFPGKRSTKQVFCMVLTAVHFSSSSSLLYQLYVLLAERVHSVAGQGRLLTGRTTHTSSPAKWRNRNRSETRSSAGATAVRSPPPPPSLLFLHQNEKNGAVTLYIFEPNSLWSPSVGGGVM